MREPAAIPAWLKPESYTHIGSYEANPWGSYFWLHWYVEELGRETGLLAESGGWLNIESGRQTYYRTDALEGITRSLRERIESRDGAYFARLCERADQEFAGALAFAKMAGTDPRPETMKGLIRHGRRVVFFWSIGWQLSILLDGYLTKEAARRGVSPERIGQYLPRPVTPLIRQQREAAKIKKLLAEDARAAESAIETHLATFNWIQNITWNGRRFTREKLMEQLAHLVPETEHDIRSSPFADLEGILRDGAYLNQAGSEYHSMYSEGMRPYLLQVSEDVRLCYDDLLFLHPEEVYDGTVRADGLDERIQRRKAGWFNYNAPDNTVHIVDDAATVHAVGELFRSKCRAGSVTELSGNVAVRGRAVGPACIIATSADFAKFQAGDVLFAPMTTPDFVFLMQKSVAVVTDMGGMLSHAAIVSRELQKPCIVGTKSGTQTFHDGDLVEVDAEKGVVRKL